MKSHVVLLYARRLGTNELLQELDFEEFSPEMMAFLEAYRANEKSKKDAKAKAVAARKADEEREAEENSAAGTHAKETEQPEKSPFPTPTKVTEGENMDGSEKVGHDQGSEKGRNESSKEENSDSKRPRETDAEADKKEADSEGGSPEAKRLKLDPSDNVSSQP